MSFALTAARLLLSIVFSVAGFAKMADRGGSREALIGFGAPTSLAKPLAFFLPLAELAIAAMLIPVGSAWLAAVGALFLLLCFLIAIGINLARGRAPECHCFGQLHSAPAGSSTLARNALLACVAGFLVWQGPGTRVPSLFSWFSVLAASQRVALGCAILALVLLAGQAVLLLQVLKQQGRILLRLDAREGNRTNPASDTQPPQVMAGLPTGTGAPNFRLNDLHKQSVTLDDLLINQKPVLLLFTNPNCGPCQALLPEASRWQREYRAQLTIALISEGLADDNRTRAAEHELSKILLQQKREVAELYQAWGTPAAVLIRSDGAIASALAQGAEAIQRLVEQSVSVVAPAPESMAFWAAASGSNGSGHYATLKQRIKRGDPAPPVELRNLEDEVAALADFRDRVNLVLFWNPRCGFCQQMLKDLRNWDANPPAGAPRFVVISTGTVEDGRAMGLRSPVLIDPASQAAIAFGVAGTPTAVLLDTDLRIASDIAAGAQAVFALADAKVKPSENIAPNEGVRLVGND